MEKLRFAHGDWVRLVVASCLTVMALPVLLREANDQRADRPPTVAAVAPGGEVLASPLGEGTAPGPPSDAATAAPASEATTTPTDVADPSFLTGPTTPLTAKSITVVVPATTTDTTRTGRASYRRWAPGSTSISAPCAAWFLEFGTKVTVTNLDNGHTAECVVADRTGVPKDQVIVLDTPVFALLADVVEAPIPVAISWT